MDEITSPVVLSKKEKKAIENKSHRDRLKLNPGKTEAVKIQVHENYTNRKAAETPDDKENRDYKRRKLEAMTDDERKEMNKKESERKKAAYHKKKASDKESANEDLSLALVTSPQQTERYKSMVQVCISFKYLSNIFRNFKLLFCILGFGNAHFMSKVSPFYTIFDFRGVEKTCLFN